MSRIIATYDNGTWSTTEFKDDTEFQEFIFDLFKEPGKYEFDETQERPYIQDIDGNVITINFNTDTEGNA